MRRTALGLLLAIFCTAAFTLAGGFSSQIQFNNDNLGGSVLINGASCATLPDVTNLEEQVAYEKTIAKSFYAASNYVQQCYSENSTGLTDCNYFVTQRLPGYIDTAAPCPFDDSICRSNSSNLELDTGYLDSHTHFGVNAPPNERILVRRKLQCAPLKTEGYNSENGNFTRYYYGPRYVSVSNSAPVDKPDFNATYEVANLENQYARSTDMSLLEQSYLLRPFFAGTQNYTISTDPASSFVPIDELARTDADLFVVFLSGHGVFFTEPFDDEWYRATEPFGNLGYGGDESFTVYRPAESASPLGCAAQWQFCHSDSSNCGPMASYYDAKHGALQMFASDTKVADRLQWLTWSLSADASVEAAILQQLQGDALLSKLSLITGYQGSLPLNEWQLDVSNWFAVYLSRLQSSLLETASGSMVADAGFGSLEPDTDAARKTCINQKIRTTRYSSFSFFGIMFTYVLGGLVLVVSYSLEPILDCLHRRRKYKQYAYLEWVTNETLQLHRLAHEEADGASGPWSRCTNWIPTTSPGVALSSLDISDLKHPRLQQTTKEKHSSSMSILQKSVSPNHTLIAVDSIPSLNTFSRQQTLNSLKVASPVVGNPAVRPTHAPAADYGSDNIAQSAQSWLSSPVTEPSSPQYRDEGQSRGTIQHSMHLNPGEQLERHFESPVDGNPSAANEREGQIGSRQVSHGATAITR
ncbi:hypothetical protein Daus18300_011386 [Diaporthe australafricana]|uniref:Uncharacterized protein n=1 Tax=Diaporthe australafricana TaxID=127596 RepID=A0ABR3W6J1_9PEZI